jgi:hypothetical protein
MSQFQLSTTFKKKIEFDVLNAEGKKEKWELTAVFERKTTDQVKELVDECKSDADIVRRVLTGWTWKHPQTKELIEFSDEAVNDAIQNIAGWATLMSLQYMECVGVARSKG